MKIEIEREKFGEALKSVRGFLGSGIVDLFRYFLLVALKDRVIFKAANGDQLGVCSLDTGITLEKNEKEESILLEGDSLVSLLDLLEGDKVEIEKEDSKIKLTCGKFKIDFVERSELDSKNYLKEGMYEISKDLFIKANWCALLKKVFFATLKIDMKIHDYVLSRVQVRIRKVEDSFWVELRGMDSYRIAAVRSKEIEVSDKIKELLEKKEVLEFYFDKKVVEELIKNEGFDIVHFSEKLEKMEVRKSNFSIFGMNDTRKYPEYQVWDKAEFSLGKSIFVDCQEFKRALERLSFFVREEFEYNVVDFELGKDRIKMKAFNGRTRAEDEIKVENSKEEMKFGLSPGFVLEFLSGNLGEDKVVVNMNGKQIVFGLLSKTEGQIEIDKNFVYVISVKE